MASTPVEIRMGYGKYRKSLIGSFAPQGTGAPTQPTDETDYVVITRTGVGVYLFTLVEKHVKLAGIPIFGFQLNTAVPTIGIVTGATAVGSTKTFSVTFMQESAGSFAAADIAANANNRIGYEIEFSDTGLTP